jgi:HlyD family secretion protein
MKLFRSVLARRSKRESDKVVRLYQSETAEFLERPAPLRARITIFAFTSLLITILVAASLLHIDRVVSSTFGQVVTTQGTQVVQALDASIIKTIDVREGEQVKAGQLLATLDPTFAAADVGTLKDQIASLDAQIARCEAELAGKIFVATADSSPSALRYVGLQRSYYEQRKNQYDAQVHSYDEQIAQISATIAKTRNDQARFGDRAKLAGEVEQMRATLAANQVGSRLNLLTATDQKTDLLRQLELDSNSLIEAQHQLASVGATKQAFMAQWLGQTSQELVTARNQRDTAQQQLEKAIRHQDLVKIYAQEDAVVLKMAKLSAGSVLKEGEVLLYLAPLRSPVEAEVRITPRDVGHIRAGDAVIIKLDPFNFVEHGSAEGQVRWISEGAFTTDDNSSPVTSSSTGPAAQTGPYYKARIAFTNTNLRNVPETFRLIPGMTLTADINIGTRSVLMYLISGTLQGMGEAMREP